MKKNTIQYQKEITHCSVVDNNTILKEEDNSVNLNRTHLEAPNNSFCVSILTHSSCSTVDTGYEGARSQCS